MANYSLVINSQFKPFSYAEMLAPVMQATQAHQALEDAYGELDAKASIWDKLANESPDSKARKLYQGYADDLRAQADELAKNGLNPSSRQAMLNMRSRYTKDILPIENAWNRRNEDIKAQKQAMLSDPTHVFDVSAANTSLDKYLDNPTLDVMSANHSGALLTKQVADAARNFKKYLTTEEGLRRLGLPFQYVKRLKNGASPEEVMLAILRDPKASPLLTSLVDNVMAGSGIRNWSSMNGDWANNPVYNRLWNQAAQGLYEAIGNVDSKYLTDSYSMQLDLMRKKHALDNPPMDNNIPIDPIPLRSPDEVSENNKKLERFIKEGKIRVNPDGTIVMMKKGMDALKETRKPTTGGWNLKEVLRMQKVKLERKYGKGKVPQAELDKFEKDFKKNYGDRFIKDKDFYNFIKGMNGGESIVEYTDGDKLALKAGWGPHRMSNMLTQFKANNNEGAYDTYHHTGYKQQVDSTTGSHIMESIWSSAGTKDGNAVIQPVVFAGKEGWKEKGDPMTAEDLKDYRVIDKVYTKYGTVATLWKNGANPITVKIPKGMNDYYQQKVDAAVNSADELQDILQTGRRPLTRTVSLPDNTQYQLIERDNDGNIRYTDEPLTQEDITLFRGRQREHLNNMMLYGSGPGASKVSTNNINPLPE